MTGSAGLFLWARVAAQDEYPVQSAPFRHVQEVTVARMPINSLS